MDKSTLIMVNSTVTKYLKIPGLEKDVHRSYGLRITHFRRKAQYPGRLQLNPRQFRFYSLCHLIEGEGWFWKPNSQKFRVHQGEGVLVVPDETMDYAGTDQDWGEDYICFLGPVADHLFRSGVLNTGVIKIGPIRRLLPAIEKAMDPSDDSQIEANSLLQKLLVDLYLENRPSKLGGKEKAVEDMRQLLLNDSRRWWTVEEMAKECDMSVNHMRNLFKEQTGLSPKTFIENLKMRRAAERLSNTLEPISSIAADFSYLDPYHFSRVFKRIMGMSPKQYRIAQQR